VADLLAEDGIFLLMDRIALDADHFADLYRVAWNHLEKGSAVKSGQSGDEFLKQLEHKEDHPATLEEHLRWLREASFSATCLHCYLNRALFVAKLR